MKVERIKAECGSTARRMRRTARREASSSENNVLWGYTDVSESLETAKR